MRPHGRGFFGLKRGDPLTRHRQLSLVFFAIVCLIGISLRPRASAAQPAPGPPAGSAPVGEEIIKKSKALLYKIQDQKNKVTLKLIEKDGSQREIVAWRYWKNYNNQDGFDSKTVLFTESPADSRGVGFLIWDYSEEGKPDDLWLYLPALRITRRISSRDQNDAFLGSDLTFGDMGQRRLDEDVHRTLGEEAFRGVQCWVVESLPKEKETIYGKKLTWVSQVDYTIQKIDYYDRNQKLLKRQTIDWQTVKDRGNDVFVWKKTDILNVQNGHKTIFEVSDLTLNVGLSDGDFTERVLKTGGLRK